MAFSHSVWQLGLLRVAVGLFVGSILTLAYGLGGDGRADRAAVKRVWRAEQWGDGRIGHGPLMAGTLAPASLRAPSVETGSSSRRRQPWSLAWAGRAP